MSTTETTVQLLNRRDAITSRIATYRQPGQPIRPEDREELEAVMAEIHRREVAEQVVAFDADPHAWTDENGMRYRCKRCHEPMLSILPTELTSGVCRCGGLIEADPRNFADIDPAGRTPCREVAHGPECPGDCDPKVGDRVICTDDSASFNRLRRGDTYTVEANFDGSPTVMVNGCSHSIERFRTVREARP